ncbi:MAG TPA: YMGG-like glycine zipper-containing protein [Methylophilaceae bacterium]
MNNLKKMAVMLPVLLSACASVPNGPSSMALPGTGKSFDQFRADDASCRQFAQSQIGDKTANEAGNDSFARNAVLGTALGAVVGAVVGGGHGAAVGAGVGLAGGSVVGANESEYSARTTQNRYDDAYTQCMYSSGHRVRVSGNLVTQPAPASAPRPSAPPPPPPPGASAYPPPPPDYRP